MKSATLEIDPLIGIQFEDENHHIHIIKEKLSSGGQGAVYRTQDPNVLIKLKINPENEEVVVGEDEYKKYVKDLMEVRIADVPLEVNIAKPVLFLKSPQCGYIMRTLDNMVPIQELMYHNKIENPLQHYHNTGGLKRRLAILANFTRMFALLHSKPLIYADLSEGNLFVPAYVDSDVAYLIDADNLRHRVNFKETFCTPGYGAPEIEQQLSFNTTYSDVYSFAIIAYKVLTYRTHPFYGNLMQAQVVSASDDEGWDDDEGWNDDENEVTDPYLLAQYGKFPWTDDPDDDRNRTNSGFPIERVASKKMFDLFQRTFSEKGRVDPASRPLMEEWYEVLRGAYQATVECDHCDGSYFITERKCPYCNETKQTVTFLTVSNLFDINKMLEDDEGFKPLDYSDPEVMKIRRNTVDYLVLEEGKKGQFITNVHLIDSFISEPIENLIEVEIANTVFLRNVSKHTFLVLSDGERRVLQPYASLEERSIEKVKILSPVTNTRSRLIEFVKRGS